MNRFRSWMQRMMSGRYGMDQFGMFLSIVSIILFIVSMFTTSYVDIAALGIMVYMYIRYFSRNINARSRENEWFLRHTEWFRQIFNKNRQSRAYDANYKIFKCPKCRQKLRVPRGRGKIEIRCRKCGEQFIRKT